LPSNPLERLALRAFGGLATLCGAVGVRGIIPAATLGIFLIVAGALAWYGWRMLRRLLAGA
jgi:membrane protein implicated in regulation of membrane protease activity